VLIAGAGVLVLFLLAYSGAATRRQQIDRRDIQRVKRLAERMRREEMWPFDEGV